MKQVIVLVGPKGAGKWTIGDFLATGMGIHFLRVEPLFLEVRSQLGASHPDFERLGFESVLLHVNEALSRYDTVCFESTGASSHIPWLLSQLGEVARVIPVHVLAELAECVDRIKGRDTSIHIPVSDDQVERINALAIRVELPWAAEIDNRGAFNGPFILDTVRTLLRTKGP